MKLTFLGANRNVTGSRYCMDANGYKVMIDCGLTQERGCIDDEDVQRFRVLDDAHEIAEWLDQTIDGCGL